VENQIRKIEDGLDFWYETYKDDIFLAGGVEHKIEIVKKRHSNYTELLDNYCTMIKQENVTYFFSTGEAYLDK